MSKTAMQELIDYFNLPKHEVFTLLKWIENNKDRLLEKEKEQIIELIRFIRTNDKMGKSIEDLYNEFYNQNK